MHGSSSSATADIGAALVVLIGFLNDPRQDARLMAEAGLDIDAAYLPLLVRLGADGPAGVVTLAGRAGRDHSTISRQLARLEASGLVARTTSAVDGRVRAAEITPKGADAIAAVDEARRRLLDAVLADWPKADRDALGRLLPRFASLLVRVGA